MKDRFANDDAELPPELAELDAELSSIAYEERPSFGPELRAELARVWEEEPEPRRGTPARQLMAAGVAGLMMLALGVPSARASLVRWVETFRAEPVVTAIPPAPAAPTPLDAGAANVGVPADDLIPTFAAPRWSGDRDAPPAHVVREVTFPEIADRAAAEAVILSNYPTELQEAGVGGTVGLQLWVDESGAVNVADVETGSGVEELDRIAVQVARTFTFTPSLRHGVPVGTWVEFDVVFQAPAVDGGAANAALPTVEPVEAPDRPGRLDVPMTMDWDESVTLPAPGRREAGEMLTAALGGAAAVAALGPIDRVLAGDPPRGVAPTSWRARVSDALEAAMVRDPDNPAPLLALGRIRQSQGLKTEARTLFERGLQKAQRGGESVSPTILAELHYERGSLVKQSWLATAGLGRVPSAALPREVCAQARSSGGAASGYASVERLTAWNYLCPEALRGVLSTAFEGQSRERGRDFAVMSGSFRAAVEAYPGHVGANVEILLALADEGRWDEVFQGARRFVWASQGHPYGVLLSGLALHRMGRSEEASDQFRLALAGLSLSEREALLDVRPLLSEDQADDYLRTAGEEREAWRRDFFSTLDPVLSTAVNEREVEHVARSVYARLRFAGPETDAGRIWVRYGEPDRVRVFGEVGNLRTEFWDYGQGPHLTLQRPASSTRMDLTSEARAYVDDLRSVLPHRYVAGARRIDVLEGRVTTFRGTAPGTVDVEIRARVPEHLATGEPDSLEVGVFVLDAAGARVSTRQGRIAARSVPLALDVTTPPTGRTVVVEVFHPGEGLGAALRYDLRPRRVEAIAGPGISDLVLARPVMPTTAPDVRRPWWLEPLSADGLVADDEVGMLAEVYGVPDGAPFTIRAELAGGNGDVRSLQVRGPGEAVFSPTWTGTGRTAGPDVAYVTVSLGEVPVGSWRVRMSVDVTDTRVEAEAPLDRRAPDG